MIFRISFKMIERAEIEMNRQICVERSVIVTHQSESACSGPLSFALIEPSFKRIMIER